MPLLNKLKGIIYKADLLNSGSLLRIKGEPEHATILGGLISITLMIVLAAAFSNKILGTLDKEIITSTVTTSNADDPTSLNLSTFSGSHFMLGVEVYGNDLNSNARSFDVLLQVTRSYFGAILNSSDVYGLEPCTRQHWADIPQVVDSFDQLGIRYWMCLPINKTYEIKGKYSSQQSITLDIYLKKCEANNPLDTRPCETQANIDKLFADNDGNLYFTVYFINPLINPDSASYLKYYLEDNNYIIFTQNSGEESRIFFDNYDISTDQSILPNSDIMTENGGIVTGAALKSAYSGASDIYASFVISKSPISLAYDRSFQKLDDVFSYIGGLFGTILIFFFVISSYNTHKYEINLAGYLYRNEGQSQKLEKKYNFLYYLGQLIFSVLKMLKCEPKWEKLSYYSEAREEMLKQLDVLFLLKRINFLQHALTFLFTDHQIHGMHLASHFTVNEAIKFRRNYKLKAKLKNEITAHRNKKVLGDNINDTIVTSFNNKESSLTQRQNDQADISFRSDRYSSESSSDQEEGIVMESVKKLQAEKEDNPTSQKILKSIDVRLKGLMQLAAGKRQQKCKEKGINFQSFETLKNDIQQTEEIFVYPVFEEAEHQTIQKTKQLFSKLVVVHSEVQHQK